MQLSIPDLPQHFTISHANEADFKSGGLREYSSYRDLGVAAATNGLAQDEPPPCRALKVKMSFPCGPRQRGRERAESP